MAAKYVLKSDPIVERALDGARDQDETSLREKTQFERRKWACEQTRPAIAQVSQVCTLNLRASLSQIKNNTFSIDQMSLSSLDTFGFGFRADGGWV